MIALFAAILCFGISQAWGADLYVDASKPTAGDGTSWAAAFYDLQAALSIAADGDAIHVAQGTYTPGDTRDASFVLVKNLTLLGGYPAGGGDRDPAANPTVLSGEIGVDRDMSDNIYHVVNIYGYNFGVTLDGFTITKGNASEGPYNMGGGMWVSGGWRVTLNNVTFSYNRAVGGGGGLRFSGESLTLSHVTFNGNMASNGNGGGLHFSGGSLSMDHVDFSHNVARNFGGGLFFSGESIMDINHVNFFNNAAVALSDQPEARGGGIYIESYVYDKPLNMTNVTLSRNQANGNDYGRGGGIYVARGPEYAPIALTNVTLSDNQANGKYALGGGICSGLSTHWRWMVLTNVTLSGNRANGIDAGQGGGIFFFPSGDLIMFHVTASGNIATGQQSALGGGVFAVPYISNFPGQVRTFIRNSIFWGNAPDQLQGVSAWYCVVQGGWDGFYNITEDPRLGTLANYGGFTQTIPLLEGSSAIDTVIAEDFSPDTDQRGVPRPQGAGYDIGAYEASPVHIVSLLVDPAGPVPVNTTVFAEAGFSDLDLGDVHSAAWNWGDGETSDGVVDEESQTVTGEHTYAQPGVYTVGLEVRDSLGGMDSAAYQYIVVYDPAAGFVTGGGWIHSPAGAYVEDPSLSGVATFGFVSKYQKGATVPTGNTEFEFKAGDLYFHSTSYDWLVVTGSNYARFKGSGAINGGGDYKFMLWAGDSDSDTFRIRIWEEDEETGEETVIYDNGSDQPIGGGSIVIHTK